MESDLKPDQKPDLKPDQKPDLKPDLKRFFESLSEKEKQAYRIAESHLGSLFNVEKTAGYLQWKAKQLH